jgi:hypothetical protein
MVCSRCGAMLDVGAFPFCKGRPSDHDRGVSMIIGDECDFTQVNGLKAPRRFRSKQEHKRWLKANGYEIVDTHVGLQGSDKSPHTTNWASTYDPYTAENAKILIERAFKSATIDAPPVQLHITTDVHDMSREEARQYVR